MTRKRLIVTPGDPQGIGPEVTEKALRSEAFAQLRGAADLAVSVVGAPEIESRLRGLGIDFVPAPSFRDTESESPEARAGFQSGWSVETAVRLLAQGKSRGEWGALVTGPISKERLRLGGYPFNGHTDFLQELTRAPEVTMMLANARLRVALVTTHLPLRMVPETLSIPRIQRALSHTADYLQTSLSIARPTIAVCALNPHAGEAGILGHEEVSVIGPALRDFHREGVTVVGPLPADTLFTKTHWDGVVAMYHDQGLIPVKQLDFQNTVNITLGLPILRTSVDHGVAFDIAGKGIADPSSMSAALSLAVELLQKKAGSS